MILALVILVLAWSVKYLLCWHSCFCIYWMSVSIIPVLGAYRFRQIFSSSLPVYRVIVYTLIILEIMGEAIRVHLVYTVCLSVYYYLPCIYLVTRRPVCYWGKGEMEWYMIIFKQSYIILLNQDSVCQCIKHAHPFNNYFHLPHLQSNVKSTFLWTCRPCQRACLPSSRPRRLFVPGRHVFALSQRLIGSLVLSRRLANFSPPTTSDWLLWWQRFLRMRKAQDQVTRSSYGNTDTTRRLSLL